MAKQEMTARVVLRKAKTYKFKSATWIKNVPRIVTGRELIKQYQNNGFFNVKVLKDEVSVKKDKTEKLGKRESVDDDVEESKSYGNKAPKGKKLLKK